MKASIILAFFLLSLQNTLAQSTDRRYFPREVQPVTQLPPKPNVWVFILAGQSNMAGRGLVEPQDTLANPRILTINQQQAVVLAKEPLHYYEPTRTGLDCGLSFAQTLLKSIPDSVSILLVSTAVGGSSIQQWLGDSTHNGVRLLSNFKEKIAIAQSVGVFKAMLWHQGESNANTQPDIDQHAARLTTLAGVFRQLTDVPDLPILVGELGSFSKQPQRFEQLNGQLLAFTKKDRYSALIKTDDLPHKGDNLHFDGQAQRVMGERFAKAYVSDFYTNANRPKKPKVRVK